jgi:hypothetical protein
MNSLFEPLMYPKRTQPVSDSLWGGTVAPYFAGHELFSRYSQQSTVYDPFIAAHRATADARAARIRTQLDPPPQPLRAFEEDYPSARWPAGPPSGTAGRLTHDVDGEPIHPDALVIGRRTLNGPDENATLTQLRDLIGTVIGARPRLVSNRKVLPKTVGGIYRKEPGWRFPPGTPAEARPEWDDGYLKDILVHRRMPAADRLHVLRHEFGHGVDDRIGDTTVILDGIPYRELSVRKVNPDELMRVWRDLNQVSSPGGMGYRPQQFQGELNAEAWRALLSDPNYAKAVMPNSVRALRGAVRNDPFLRRRLHINSLPPFRLPSGAASAFASSRRVGGLGGLGGYVLDDGFA